MLQTVSRVWSLILAASLLPSPPAAAVVGGSPASASAAPWMVSIATSSHICGGAMLNARTVLTAAQCVAGTAPARLKARVGSLHHGSGGAQLQVKSVLVHPQYNAQTHQNDVAVLHLAADIPSNYLSPVSLATAEPPIGEKLLIAGWGAAAESGALSVVLRSVLVPPVSQADCQTAYGATQITSAMFCAGTKTGGLASCKGDEGGPVTIGRVAYGIISSGKGCGQPGTPSVFTKISALRAWILSNSA